MKKNRKGASVVTSEPASESDSIPSSVAAVSVPAILIPKLEEAAVAIDAVALPIAVLPQTTDVVSATPVPAVAPLMAWSNDYAAPAPTAAVPFLFNGYLLSIFKSSLTLVLGPHRTLDFCCNYRQSTFSQA